MDFKRRRKPTLGEIPEYLVDDRGFRGCHDFGGGGSSGGTTQVVQNSDPWIGAQPYLTDVFGAGRTFFNQQNLLPQSQSPATLNAQNMIEQRARRGSPLTGQAQGEFARTLGGDYLSPDSNPYLRGAVQQALDQAAMGVQSRFSGDNFGSSANQEWLGRTLANTALPIYAQNYQTERGRQQAAALAAPAIGAADYADLEQLQRVGAARDTRAEAVQREPWERLFNYQRAIAGSGSLGGTSTTQQPYFTNPLANALGLGIGGLSLYNGLGAAGLFGGANAFGSAAGLTGAADIFSTLGPLALV